jgi:hypothetical protein
MAVYPVRISLHAMIRPLKSLTWQRVRGALAPVNGAALAVLALFAAIIAATAVRLPAGYDGTQGLNLVFALCAVIWALGLATRLVEPGSRLGASVQGVALLAALTFAAALTAASLSFGGGPYIDPALAATDRVIAPFLDVHAMYRFIDHHQDFYRSLCRVYVTLNWQPFAALGAGLLFGDARRIDTLATAWAFGLALCILPFHFLPAQGVFTFHHLHEHGWAIHPGGNYPVVLAELRSGAMNGLSIRSVAGLVTFPSFHACAAVMLACAFWPYRLLRWPMIGLNLAMAVVAVPVGSHYVIDVVIGAACGGLAFAGANALARVGAIPEPARALPEPVAGPA